MSDIAKTNSQVPDYLRTYQKASIGNVDSTDRIIPRIKLIQAINSGRPFRATSVRLQRRALPTT